MEKTVANRIAFAQTRDLLLEGQNVRICVQGQSMLPFFRSGSVITLRPLRHEDLQLKNIYSIISNSIWETSKKI